MSTFTVGAIGLVVIVVFSYLAYTKFANPFARPYTVHAVFANANGLRDDSLVRIAGVNVGMVTNVSTEPGCQSASLDHRACQAAEVTIAIQSQGLPIHDDATFAIRPRIFLEGNFFVDVSPGTPSAPVAATGHTFPIQQGIEPVQFDQVLTSLQSDTRRNLQILLQQYGKAADTSSASFNRSIQYWLPAYKYSAIVAHDAVGIAPNDLSQYIAGQGAVAGALDAHPRNLENLITDFNTTADAFARQATALQNTIIQLPKTLTAAVPAFNALNAAFAPLRQLADALVPGVRSIGRTVDVSLPFVTQLRRLVAPSELRGLTHDLAPTIPALASLTNGTIALMRDQVRPASSCIANVIYPWSQLTVPDATFNASNGFTPHKVYVEAVDYLPGLAGESRNFDANGPYIRIMNVGGTFTYSLAPGLFGQSLDPLIATQPQLPPGGRRPPYKESVPCETQAPITSLSAPVGRGPTPIRPATSAAASQPRALHSAEVRSALGLVRSAAQAAGLTVNTSRMGN